jgi:hypothetical protein
MKSRIERLLKLASVIVFPAVALATSLPARALTPADQKEVQNFTLTDDFLKRFEAAAAEGGARAEENDPKKAAAMLSSIDAMSASIAKTPASKAALDRHGLTPRQAALGAIVLMRVQMTDEMLADPKQAKYVDKAKIPSAENMAFYHAHKAEIVKAFQRGKDD